LIQFDDVKDAVRRIEKAANQTPVLTSRTLDSICGANVFLKCENYQRAGAFKFRGAFNALSMLTQSEQRAGVVTHSSGNHAQALALAAREAGVKAVIVMPEGSNPVKVEAVRGYGARVVLCSNTLASRESTAQELIANEGLSMVHPYNDERVMAGAGTAAKELIEEVGELDMVLAPVGGGGLLSGTAVSVKQLCPKAVLWGVEPAGADDAYRSMQAGKLIPQLDPCTVADGLRTSLGEKTFAVIVSRVDDIVLVSEAEIVSSMRFLWERMKTVVEPSGAVSLVPLLQRRLPEYAGRSLKVGVIISGGNVDLSAFFASIKT
jgi:threonine dehydratase